ncbi:MAG: DUF493 domain-containing protein [Isosphaeraceae bacterium]
MISGSEIVDPSRGKCAVIQPDPNQDLLAEQHEFPGPYRMKVIGDAADDFQVRVAEVVLAELESPDHLVVTARSTPGGRHVALTLDLTVNDADHVRRIYARIRGLEGTVMLL